jgi:galactose-1-phosphate uridylyltransferase
MNKYLSFDVITGRKKPESIINKSAACPFCDRAALTGILDQEGDFLLLKNKYRVLADSFQTVLIETRDCKSELSEYSPDYMRRLLRFAMKNWFKMINSNEYKSVILFKNHGALSGGTIRHPHMQIVGFYHMDCFAGITERDFSGRLIFKKNDVELNLADYPRIGFVEFNVKLNDRKEESIDNAAEFIQKSAHYFMNHQPNCHSYNIFFYLVEEKIRCKILPRYATSPLYVGYDIHLIINSGGSLIKKMQELYF